MAILGKVLLFFALVNFAIAKDIEDGYPVKQASRGIVFSNAGTATLLEPQLCNLAYCLFVDKRELDLLNIDLGDDSNAIFLTLKKMSVFDKARIFTQLDNISKIDR